MICASGGSKGGCEGRAPPGPNSFNFMKFLGKFGKIVCWRPLSRGVGAPSSGKSWIRHCVLLHVLVIKDKNWNKLYRLNIGGSKGALGTDHSPPHSRFNSFHFMHFSAKTLPNNRVSPQSQGLATPVWFQLIFSAAGIFLLHLNTITANNSIPFMICKRDRLARAWVGSVEHKKYICLWRYETIT